MNFVHLAKSYLDFEICFLYFDFFLKYVDFFTLFNGAILTQRSNASHGKKRPASLQNLVDYNHSTRAKTNVPNNGFKSSKNTESKPARRSMNKVTVRTVSLKIKKKTLCGAICGVVANS